jgi:hypothetical protein
MRSIKNTRNQKSKCTIHWISKPNLFLLIVYKVSICIWRVSLHWCCRILIIFIIVLVIVITIIICILVYIWISIIYRSYIYRSIIYLRILLCIRRICSIRWICLCSFTWNLSPRIKNNYRFLLATNFIRIIIWIQIIVSLRTLLLWIPYIATIIILILISVSKIYGLLYHLAIRQLTIRKSIIHLVYISNSRLNVLRSILLSLCD